MKQEHFILCNQTEDKAKKCVHCTKYWLSMNNYEFNSILVCNNWNLIHHCQYAEKEDLPQYPDPDIQYNCDLSCVSACLDSYGELWCCLRLENPARPAWCSEYIERTIRE